jgi:excisionase family DNA binding protein
MGTEMNEPDSTQNSDRPAHAGPWLTVHEAAQRARCGVKTIYSEVRAGRLRAARIGGRRDLRLKGEWVGRLALAPVISS